MAKALKVDICVIGAGSGGLSVAAGASQMGASTVLIERGKMGGDCLNYGCVPSKALLAAGHAAQAVRGGGRFGVRAAAPAIDSGGVYGHVRGTIAAIAPNDSVERFEGLGVTVIQSSARFTGPREIAADGYRITARRIVIATGSSPVVPPVAGLGDVPYLTNETIFDLGQVPAHLIVIGGGPVGIEMAQAHRHLGARVTVVEMFSIMANDDPELVDVVRVRLAGEGIDLREGVTVARVEKAGNGVAVVIAGNGAEDRVQGSHVLIAAGRRPNVEGLDLETAGIAYTPAGIQVDARLRTTNKRVFAIGDVAGGYQFTHMASYHAGIVLRNALFRLPAKVDTRAVPWVTYTAPELAQVGLTEDRARKQAGDIRVLRWPFAENDRARAERETDGLVKVITTPRGRILGAGIVGAHAGELIHAWVLAIGQKIKIGAVAGMIAPYPTLGEANKRAAGSFYTPALFSERTKKIVRFLSHFG
ncbi:MAG: FAD-dependent oxidoreductase [Alphaproteobacteria bacterium]|nr:FAD-dependent oxidoreductase [Alphaproteobacteria bacterium]